MVGGYFRCVSCRSILVNSRGVILVRWRRVLLVEKYKLGFKVRLRLLLLFHLKL